MQEFITAFDDSYKTTSKKITSKPGDEKYVTHKDVKPEDFREMLINHFLGKERLGVSPEIEGQEDLILFAGIDIDGKDKKGGKELSTEEKYQIALNLQKAFWEQYRLQGKYVIYI